MTTKLEQAARQALECLEDVFGKGKVDVGAITALREALAEQSDTPNVDCACGDLYPADSFGAGFIAGTGHCQNCDVAEQPEQEPVAWGKFTKDCIAVSDDQFDGAIPLYTAPVKSICYQEAYDALAAQLIKNPTGDGMDQLAQNNGLVMAMNTLQHILNEEKNRG